MLKISVKHSPIFCMNSILDVLHGGFSLMEIILMGETNMIRFAPHLLRLYLLKYCVSSVEAPNSLALTVLHAPTTPHHTQGIDVGLE